MITSQGYRVIPIEVLGVVGPVVAGLGLQGVVHWLTCWEVMLVLILLLLILLLMLLQLLLILLMMVWHVLLLLLLLWHVVLILLLWVGLQLSVGTHLPVTS